MKENREPFSLALRARDSHGGYNPPLLLASARTLRAARLSRSTRIPVVCRRSDAI
jgi:hypothetical protein